jgi:hypothetical protein
MHRSSDESTVPSLWELRLSSRLRIPHVALGALVSLTLIAGHIFIYWLVGLEWLDQSETFGLREAPRILVFFAVLLGYALGTFGYVSSHHDRDLHELGIIDLQGQPVRPISREFRTGSRRAGALGVVLGFGGMQMVQLSLGSENSAIDIAMHPEYAPLLVLTSLTWWLVGRALHAAIQGTPLDDALKGPVDLLDMRLFWARGRSALQVSIAFIIGASLMIPWVFIPGFATAWLPLIVAACTAPTLLLIVPVRGARRRIREAKRNELSGLDEQIRTVRAVALRGDPAAQARIAFLTSYRSLIADIREWPFETPALARFGLYLLLPIGSWLASALVERLVNAALD